MKRHVKIELILMNSWFRPNERGRQSSVDIQRNGPLLLECLTPKLTTSNVNLTTTIVKLLSVNQVWSTGLFYL